MGKKRKNSGFSDDVDGEADDIGFDLRLARRLKRRRVAHNDVKLKSVGKSSFKGGKCNEASVHCVKLGIDADSGDVDADYKKFLDSLSSVLTGDDGFSSHWDKACSSGDYENLVNNDAGSNHMRTLESNDIEIGSNNEVMPLQIEIGGNREGIMDFYYRRYLDILSLEDENACFIDRGVDVNAVNGFIENDNSGADLVGNEFTCYYASEAITFGEKKSNSDCVDGAAVEIDTELIENGTFGSSSQDGGDIDMDGGSLETRTRSNDINQNDDLDNTDPAYGYFLKNMMKDIDCSDDDRSLQTQSRGKDSVQNVDFDNSDTADDFFPKNIGKDGNVTSVDILDDDGSLQTQSWNKDTGQNNYLDNNDPDYEFFLKNVRNDGASFVFEIPLNDGTSQIVKYELGDGFGVENPDATRSSQEGLFEHDLKDEAYDEFVKNLKSERGLVVYMPESGPKVVYDEDEESSSDSDVVILETNPFIQSYEILSDDEEGDCNQGASRSDSWFREKVMEILRKPFDQKEYTRLLHDAHVHKPVVEDLDLRNGRSRRRVVHFSGKSYLDVHKDLNRKINEPGSTPPKVLNLLRGFFYWLQNTPHDVFKPWEDELCLKVLPSTS